MLVLLGGLFGCGPKVLIVSKLSVVMLFWWIIGAVVVMVGGSCLLVAGGLISVLNLRCFFIVLFRVKVCLGFLVLYLCLYLVIIGWIGELCLSRLDCDNGLLFMAEDAFVILTLLLVCLGLIVLIVCDGINVGTFEDVALLIGFLFILLCLMLVDLFLVLVLE